MDSTVPPSRPVAITVASEQEPIEVSGVYAEHDGGFVLEFSIERDRFTIDHSPSTTRIAAVGGLSYDISLSEKESSTLLSTPYGNIRFAVTPVLRDVVTSNDGLAIVLEYVLTSADGEKIKRSVDIKVRF